MKFCDLSAADKRQSPTHKRAKQPPSGDAMVAYSSSSGLLRELPVRWLSETMSQLNTGPSFSAPKEGEKYEQI